jgi:hypothetical protein
MSSRRHMVSSRVMVLNYYYPFSDFAGLGIRMGKTELGFQFESFIPNISRLIRT